jgi:rubredoxin
MEEERHSIIDLSWIGNGNTYDNDEPSQYSCPDCNVALIEKKDDMAHLGYQYNRWICSRCGQITDPYYDDSNSIKHREKITPITDPSNSMNKAYAEVLSFNNNNSSNDDDDDDYYEDPEPHEMEDLQRRGCSKIETVTTVLGRTYYEKWESE